MDDMTTLAHVNGDVVSWAIERASLTRASVAARLSSEESPITESLVAKWEDGRAPLSLRKALDFARIVCIPFGYLFLSSPPTENLPIPDLRRVGDTKLTSLSVDFREVLNAAILKQQWFREYQLAIKADPVAIVGTFTIKDAVEDVAKSIRATLRIDKNMRSEAKTAPQLVTSIARHAEQFGILVMRSGIVGSNNDRKLSEKEFRGFAISDPLAPLIFINTNDAYTAQVFTCVHELVHIWLGTSGVSNVESSALTQHFEAVEEFCNAVAASVLAPRDLFLDAWHLLKSAKAVASHFRISQQVVLRRAYGLGLLRQDEFLRMFSAVSNKGKAKASGGIFHYSLPSRNSPRFTRTILDELKNGRLLYRDAARFLAVKPNTLIGLMNSKTGE
jgi:Zn-dependent peptidase ImmA (M78 family)